ncbi:hypothetical protein F0562_021737 [Nyssa sinensis]|uniref:RlpA-like protein double-psi beta-barrel domain-containing protein n=1 Tax=Nyssa sinensis TaxID=561372 RepID=A0A5J5BN31_9ASTE|nr:hypothetical protein F0562_021737 [Nyssa sinensis]
MLEEEESEEPREVQREPQTPPHGSPSSSTGESSSSPSSSSSTDSSSSERPRKMRSLQEIYEFTKNFEGNETSPSSSHALSISLPTLISTMANLMLLSLVLLFNIIFLPLPGNAISSCNGPCQTLNDCSGQLICINGKCNDDPDVGTHICQGTPPSPPSPNSCKPSGTLKCGANSYPTYTCSPPVTSSTPAKLTNNDFSKGGDGGGPSECDGQYHDNSKPIVALSTGWYNGGSRCGKNIRIRANNGRSVVATVVDECDSRNGCDEEHAGQPPCHNNIVDGSDGVWSALGLDTDVGIVDITWSMA